MKYSFWDDFLVEGTEDYVGIWQIISEIKYTFSDMTPERIQDCTLEAIREILETGSMHIGMFEPDEQGKLEYRVWQLSADKSINRIKSEWDLLGREPSIGEIAWLITSQEGERKVSKA